MIGLAIPILMGLNMSDGIRVGTKACPPYRAVFIWILAIFMAGCADMASWEVLTFPNLSGPIPGAQNVGNARPPVLRRCSRASNSYAKCDYGFTDSNRNVVSIYSDLMKALDAHAEQTPELKPWVNKVAMKNAPDPATVPYKMFLLTISPAIVLVVPITPSRSKYYEDHCNTLLFRGCIQSQGFRGSAYWFQGSPPITKGSFWFTTEERQGAVHYLNNGQTAHELTVGQAVVRLSKTDARWAVQRVR